MPAPLFSRAAVALVSMVALPAGPATAGLINTYGSTDDVWSPPLGQGSGLLDVRLNHTLPNSPLMAASLAYGLGSGSEIGLWGGYALTGLGTAQQAGAPSVLNPYVKVQAPWTPGGSTLGLVAGAQLPTQVGMDSNVALTAVASLPLSQALSLDLNLGVGRTLVSTATLGHAGAYLYYTLPNRMGLIGEAFAYLSSLSGPTFGQHVALTVPLHPTVSGDVGLVFNEAASGALTSVTPHVGATLTW